MTHPLHKRSNGGWWGEATTRFCCGGLLALACQLCGCVDTASVPSLIRAPTLPAAEYLTIGSASAKDLDCCSQQNDGSSVPNVQVLLGDVSTKSPTTIGDITLPTSLADFVALSFGRVSSGADLHIGDPWMRPVGPMTLQTPDAIKAGQSFASGAKLLIDGGIYFASTHRIASVEAEILGPSLGAKVEVVDVAIQLRLIDTRILPAFSSRCAGCIFTPPPIVRAPTARNRGALAAVRQGAAELLFLRPGTTVSIQTKPH